MKKFLAVFLAVSIVFSLSACGNKLSVPDNNSNASLGITDVKHTGKKISGEITGASVFSDGLALVCVNKNKEKTYCINKDGYIVFELDKQLTTLNGIAYEKFINGYVFIDGGICNTKGEITYPQDVGATQFFRVALEGGYIVATKITSDYNSSKNELGVMNMDFEWVLQPSEEIYSAVEENLWTTTVLNTESFYSDGVVYFDGCKRYLDIKSGQIFDKTNIKQPSQTWLRYTDNTFRDCNENVMVDLNKYENIVLCDGSNYINEKAPVMFYNQQADMRFFTLVDEKGNFLFEPIESKYMTQYGSFRFDGETVVILDNYLLPKIIKSYNSKGELIGELNTETIDVSWCDIKEGVILLTVGGMNSKKCYFYNTDFTPLFSVN